MAKLVAEVSTEAAAWVSALAIVPFVGIMRLRYNHNKRTSKFTTPSGIDRSQALKHAMAVTLVVALSVVAVATLAFKSLS